MLSSIPYCSILYAKLNSNACVMWIRRVFKANGLDLIALLEAAIIQQDEPFVQSGVDAALLATLMQYVSQPLLRACARAGAVKLESSAWDHGYCPLCAAWAALAEVRGLEQRRWLRCGRCAAQWRLALPRCYCCGNDDFSTLGYLASESEHQARQASTCDVCGSYLKTFPTISALTPAELLLKDLSSVELDMAALGQNYTRPDQPAFSLQVHVRPA